MLLSGPSRSFSMEKFLSQNTHYETKSFTELVTKYFMKFEKEIDGYFPSLGKDGFAFIKTPFTANAQMLQTGTGIQEEMVKLQYEGFERAVYAEKYSSHENFCFMMGNSYKNLLHLLFKHCCCFHQHGYVN